MRFMLLLETKDDPSSYQAPDSLMEAIGEHGQRETEAGRLVDTAGLAPPAMGGAKLRLRNSKITVTDGPFTESKEMVASYAIVEVASRDEAVEMARTFLELHQAHWPGWEGSAEVRQIFGPADFPPPGA
jgi:hypothetical protein